MGSVVGLTVIKSMSYRGSSEQWSNKYHFSGAIPADATAWRALFDALVLQEKTLYDSAVTVVGGYGYDSDAANAHAVWSLDLSASPVSGTLSATGGVANAGDSAVWTRWKTSRTNSKGKPIYLRKYYHRAVTASSGSDAILTGQHTALEAFAAKLLDGTFIDARTVRSRTHAETILSRASSLYATTRTLKRRGKRP